MKNKKLISILITLILILTLVACSGDKSKESKNAPKEETKVEDTEKSEPNDEEIKEGSEDESSEVGKVEESEFGRLEIIKQDKNINDLYESGPVKLTVEGLQIGRLNPSEDYKDMFGGNDEYTVLTILVEVENTSDETISFYPDQGVVVTNTKEQKDASIIFSDNVGGDFIGQVIKKGNIIFLLDSKAEDINNLKFVLAHPSNSKFDRVGDDMEFSYQMN